VEASISNFKKMKKAFALLSLLFVATFTFAQKQYVPDAILADIKKSAKEVLGKLPSNNELRTSIISAKDYTIIINLKRLCESLKSKSTMTIPELEKFDAQLKGALNPSVLLSMKDQNDANKEKSKEITIDVDGQPCTNCVNKNIDCLRTGGPSDTPIFLCAMYDDFCRMTCINVRIQPLPVRPKAQAIKVEATIEKIYCRSVDDGRNDNTEEVYGKIELLMGQVCYDGDAERHPPVEATGNYLWELKPENFIKLKKGQTKNINQKKSWKYSLPPNCGMIEGQTVVICRSDLDERDLPHDADDKLEGGCPGGKVNHCCYSEVYLNQVLELGSKTFKFVQTHSSGGTVLEVYFKVVVTSQSPIKGGGIPDTNGNSKN